MDTERLGTPVHVLGRHSLNNSGCIRLFGSWLKTGRCLGGAEVVRAGREEESKRSYRMTAPVGQNKTKKNPTAPSLGLKGRLGRPTNDGGLWGLRRQRIPGNAPRTDLHAETHRDGKTTFAKVSRE